MKHFRFFIIIASILPLIGFSQGVNSLKINEILVINDSNYIDDFGERNGWIEIFNANYNYVDMGGMYLTNDLSNPTKYYIPKGDPRTVIPPRGFIVFYANNKPTRGIMHLNFELKGSKVVAIFSSDGKTLIDKLDIPEEQHPDVTYGRLRDGGPELGYLEKTTPKASNVTEQVATPAEIFGEMDPHGIAITIIAMSVVFVSLALLYILFKNNSKIYSLDLSSIFKRKKGPQKEEEKAKIGESIPGEVAAAIAMALYQYHAQIHDVEKTVLTIRRVSRTYSPWSSKIYGLRKSPR